VDNTRGYARVSHSRQWSNYNHAYSDVCSVVNCCGRPQFLIVKPSTATETESPSLVTADILWSSSCTSSTAWWL